MKAGGIDASLTKPRREAPLIPSWVGPLIIGGAFLSIFVAETRRPLRKQRESRTLRTSRNFTMAGLSAGSMALLQPALLIPLLRRTERHRLGLLHQMHTTPAMRAVLGVLLLDYTLWWWHWLNHKVPFLWRFHLAHHVDRDLDASTAIRFHFGEMSLSVLFRMLIVRIFGINELSMTLWHLLLMPSIFFQHSNLELTPQRDRTISRWVVTPRMHGIHHSDYRNETDSNWSSLFSVWDFLHGTFREDVPQKTIRIGVAAFQSPEDVTLPKIIAMPFVEQRDDWRNETGTLQIERDTTCGRAFPGPASSGL